MNQDQNGETIVLSLTIHRKAYLKSQLDCVELSRVDVIDHEIRKTVLDLCLPSNIKDGLYVVPRPNLTKLCDTLEVLQVKRKALVDKFLAVYPLRVKFALKNKRNKPSGYPPPAVMAKMFDVEINFLAIKEPESIEELRDDIREREHRRAENRSRVFSTSTQSRLRGQFLGLVDDLLRVMESTAVHSFSNQRIQSIRQFNQTVGDRNVVGDSQLEKVAASVRAMLRGVTPRVVCYSDVARMELAGRIREASLPLRSVEN